MKFVPCWGPSLTPVACQLNVVVDDGGGLSGACIICTISVCVSWGSGWGLEGLLCYVSVGLPVPSTSSRVCIGEMEGTKALWDCCVGFSQTACLQAACRCYQHCLSLCIVEIGMLKPFLTVGLGFHRTAYPLSVCSLYQHDQCCGDGWYCVAHCVFVFVKIFAFYNRCPLLGLRRPCLIDVVLGFHRTACPLSVCRLCQHRQSLYVLWRWEELRPRRRQERLASKEVFISTSDCR